MTSLPKTVFMVLRLVVIYFVLTVTIHAEEYKLDPTYPEAGDNLGFNVDIDGDYAIIGVPYKDSLGIGSDVGKAYIYVRSGNSWIIQDSLTSSDASADDNFGYSVAIDGNYAIVGAPFWDSTGVSNYSDAGKVFVYLRSGSEWNEQAVLISSDPKTNQYFGWSVSLDGAYAAIGAYRDDQIGLNAGAAYIFLRTGSTWNQQQKLLASDQEINDRFGQSVSISGDWIVVGSYYDDDSGRNAGAAYFFQRSGVTWTQQDKATPATDDSLYFFGLSVSMDGDYAIIGAPAPNADPQEPGSAYIYLRSGTSWNQQQQITASDPVNRDLFGNSVSISGDYVVVGSPRDDTAPPPVIDHGSVYAFLRSGTQWNQTAKITASDVAAGDYFGFSVSIDNNFAIIGAPQSDSTGIGADVGSVYIYEAVDDLALPVTLISFDAISTNLNSVILKWSTSSEFENLGFIINRSSERDENSTTVASYLNDNSLRGAGNSSYQNNYSFEDKSITAGNTYTYTLISVSFNGVLETQGQIQITVSEEKLPDNIVLYSNYPNPFNPVTYIKIFIPDDARILTDFKLTIYNSNGQKIKSIDTAKITKGFNIFRWDGKSDTGMSISSGIYYAVLNYGKYNQVIKMSLLK